jgi:hypothetical protein
LATSFPREWKERWAETAVCQQSAIPIDLPANNLSNDMRL